MHNIADVRAVNAHVVATTNLSLLSLLINDFKIISLVDALVNISTILNWWKSGYPIGSVNFFPDSSVKSTAITKSTAEHYSFWKLKSRTSSKVSHSVAAVGSGSV